MLMMNNFNYPDDNWDGKVQVE